MKIIVLTFRERDEELITAKIEKTCLKYEDKYTLKSAQTCCATSSVCFIIVVTLTFELCYSEAGSGITTTTNIYNKM